LGEKKETIVIWEGGRESNKKGREEKGGVHPLP